MIENLVKSIVNPLVNDLVPINSSEYIFDFLSLQTSLTQSLIDLSAAYTRAGTKHLRQGGVYVAYGANAFGTDLDPVDVEYGYYSETAATNIWTYSTDFTNAVWVTNQTIGASGDSAFSGGASNTVGSSAVFGHKFIRPSILAGSGVLSTFSFIVKAVGLRYVSIGRVTTTSTVQTWVFDLQDGDIFQTPTSPDYTNGKIVSIGNGWYRISVNVNSTTAAIRQCSLYMLSNTPTTPVTNDVSDFTGDGNTGILISHAQLETGGRASSPIITTSSTVTRAADVLSLPTSSIAGFIAAQYSLISHHICTDDLNGTCAASLNDGTGDNRLALTRNGATNDVNVYSGGSTVVSQLMGNGLIESKLGSSAIINNFLASCNGVAGTADVSAAMPIAPTTLNIGHNLGSNQLNGHLFELALTTYAVTQAQLNTETTL